MAESTSNPPRIAIFHVAVEAEDEVKMNLWLTTMAEMVSVCAERVTEKFDGAIKLVKPLEYGQSVPVIDEPVKERDEV